MCDEETRQGIETIKGEVLSVEGSNYVVERFDGRKRGRIGDRIEAKVGSDEQKHVLSVRQLEW